MVRATDIKYFVDPPLNEIKGIGNKSHTRGQIVKKVWAHIKRRNSKVSRATQQSTTARPTKVDR